MPADVRSSGRSGGIPRGLATSGWPLLSHGFRPFFLAAGLFAAFAMLAWIGALIYGWGIGGDTYGALNWHAHEMLFGYVTAALAGFMLPAIPNWTGRLPVSGSPLLALVLLWLAGRGAMLAPDLFGLYPAAMLDAAFLPALAVIEAHEIIAGRNWKNLKILVALVTLSALNVGFHALVLTGGDPMVVFRATVAVFIALITVIGGRLVPSSTRNWLSRAEATRLPAPFGKLDRVAIVTLVAALVAWTAMPVTPTTAVLCGLAAVLHAVRLVRWRGHATLAEPLVLVLHLAYAFVPLGLAAVTLTALGWLSAPSALHILTVGAIGNMTLAVMTRATLGHTGRQLNASTWTCLAYFLMLSSAAIRPLAELLPAHYHPLLAISGTAWILAFALFVAEYGPMLMAPKSSSPVPYASPSCGSSTLGVVLLRIPCAQAGPCGSAREAGGEQGRQPHRGLFH